MGKNEESNPYSCVINFKNYFSRVYMPQYSFEQMKSIVFGCLHLGHILCKIVFRLYDSSSISSVACLWCFALFLYLKGTLSCTFSYYLWLSKGIISANLDSLKAL